MRRVELEALTRPAAGDPAGALVLLHGRGADADDLFPLLDLLDPKRRLLGATPRGPLSLPPGGRHWYVLAGIPTPHPETFHASHDALCRWLDGFLDDHGLAHDRLALGGFSQGAVMSYAVALGREWPRPAAISAFSGFIPEVPGFELDLSPPLPLISIGHGTHDPVIPVQFGRRAAAVFDQAEADVAYQETPMAHQIDPDFVRVAAERVAQALP